MSISREDLTRNEKQLLLDLSKGAWYFGSGTVLQIGYLIEVSSTALNDTFSSIINLESLGILKIDYKKGTNIIVNDYLVKIIKELELEVLKKSEVQGAL